MHKRTGLHENINIRIIGLEAHPSIKFSTAKVVPLCDNETGKMEIDVMRELVRITIIVQSESNDQMSCVRSINAARNYHVVKYGTF